MSNNDSNINDSNINDDNTSLLSNLKNKLTYKLHNIAYDPNANRFAEERVKKQKQEEDKKKEEKTDNNATDADDNPNKFSFKRVLKKTVNKTFDIVLTAIIPFVALMLAMIVSNELIVYSVPIRVLFFIFTFIVCLFPPAALILGFFYIMKSGYSYYYNHMTDRPTREIMPTIYALLPITTYQSTSTIGSLLSYPFTYPKNDIAKEQLPKTMMQYWSDLQSSFKDFDKIKNLPIFAKEIKQIQKNLSELHIVKDSIITDNIIPTNINNE
jgi:aconitase A